MTWRWVVLRDIVVSCRMSCWFLQVGAHDSFHVHWRKQRGPSRGLETRAGETTSSVRSKEKEKDYRTAGCGWRRIVRSHDTPLERQYCIILKPTAPNQTADRQPILTFAQRTRSNAYKLSRRAYPRSRFRRQRRTSSLHRLRSKEGEHVERCKVTARSGGLRDG